MPRTQLPPSAPKNCRRASNSCSMSTNFLPRRTSPSEPVPVIPPSTQAADSPAWWAEQARERLDWQTPFSTVLDDSNPPFIRLQRPTAACRRSAGHRDVVTPGFVATEMLAGMPDQALDRVRGQIPVRRLRLAVEISLVLCFLAAVFSSFFTAQFFPVYGVLLI